MSEADHANARDWSKLLAPRCVGRALSPQAQEAAVESIFQKALESLWQTNFQNPDEKKNAAQMLISLLDAVARCLDLSQNAPLCDKARVMKCVLETLVVPQPDLHSAFECMCVQAKERVFRVLDGTSAGMELKKAAGWRRLRGDAHARGPCLGAELDRRHGRGGETCRLGRRVERAA